MSAIGDDSDSIEYFDLYEKCDESFNDDHDKLQLKPIPDDSIEQIPLEYQHIFGAYDKFNYVQANVFDAVFKTDEPVVISAPTGSGKTAIFEIAIVRLISAMKKIGQKAFKIVYLAPLKALCSERLVDWNGKFEKHELKMLELTGDSEDIDYDLFQKTNIIITTPEKWDSLTRRWKNQRVLVEHIKLFLIDEIHLLNEDCRGSTLEAVICRMKTIQNMLYGKLGTIRMIAVSATIPNTDDVAMLLRTPDKPAKFFKFGEEHRPVKLNKIVLGYPSDGKSSFQFDMFLNYKLRPLIKKYSENKPTLIFCPTRKSIQMASKSITQEISFSLSNTQSQYLKDAARKVRDPEMKTFLERGFGLHHGGLDTDSRLAVEEAFRKGFLPIVFTTSTLSMGINLPAHLVIIKSTELFTAGSYETYSENMILQMIGRAGRPQFDTSATAVIMTKDSDKAKFENLVNRTQLIESNLHKNLVEHINSEVVLKTIIDLSVALDWIRSTFLYVRALKNPKHYSIPVNLPKDKIEKKLLDIFQTELNALAKAGMLTLSSTHNLEITSTSNGYLMANYYVAFSSMRIFTKMSGNENLSEVLSTICKCSDFSDSQLRTSDKKILNALNSDKNTETIRFPMAGRIKTRDMKINCIIQAIFGCLSIADPSLKQEALKIMKTGKRLTRVLSKYFEHKRNCFSALLNTSILHKCFKVQLWENSKYVSKQLPKIGSVYSSMLTSGGKETFQSLAQSNPFDIERLIGRAPPIGSEIKKAASLIPKFKIEALKARDHEIKRYTVVFRVSLENRDLLSAECTVPKNALMTFIVGSSENEVLFFTRKSLQYYISNATLQAEVSITAEREKIIKAVILSEDWVGFDCSTFLKIDCESIIEDQIDVSLGEIRSLEISEDVPNIPKKKTKLSTKARGGKTQNQKSTECPKQKNTIHNYLTPNKTKVIEDEEPENNIEPFQILDSDSEYDNINSDADQTDAENWSDSSVECIGETVPETAQNHKEKANLVVSAAGCETPRRSVKQEVINLIDTGEHFDVQASKFSSSALEKFELRNSHHQAKQEPKYDIRSSSSANTRPVDHKTTAAKNKDSQLIYQKQVIKNNYTIKVGLNEVLKEKSIECKSKMKVVSNEKFSAKRKRALTKMPRSLTDKGPQLKYLEEFSKNVLPTLCDRDLSDSNVELYQSEFSIEESPEQNCLVLTRKLGNETISQPILHSGVLQTYNRLNADGELRTAHDPKSAPTLEGRFTLQSREQKHCNSSYSFADQKDPFESISPCDISREQAKQPLSFPVPSRARSDLCAHQRQQYSFKQPLQPNNQYRMTATNSNYEVQNWPSSLRTDQRSFAENFAVPVSTSFESHNIFNSSASATAQPAHAAYFQQPNQSIYQNQAAKTNLSSNEWDQTVRYSNQFTASENSLPTAFSPESYAVPNSNRSTFLAKNFIDHNNNHSERLSQMNFVLGRPDSGAQERSFMPFYPNTPFSYMNTSGSRNVKPSSTVTSSEFNLGYFSRMDAPNPNINQNYRQY